MLSLGQIRPHEWEQTISSNLWDSLSPYAFENIYLPSAQTNDPVAFRTQIDILLKQWVERSLPESGVGVRFLIAFSNTYASSCFCFAILGSFYKLNFLIECGLSQMPFTWEVSCQHKFISVSGQKCSLEWSEMKLMLAWFALRFFKLANFDNCPFEKKFVHFRTKWICRIALWNCECYCIASSWLVNSCLFEALM